MKWIGREEYGGFRIGPFTFSSGGYDEWGHEHNWGIYVGRWNLVLMRRAKDD